MALFHPAMLFTGWIGKMLTQMLRLRTMIPWLPFLHKTFHFQKTQLNCLSKGLEKRKQLKKKQVTIRPSSHRQGTIILEELS